MTEKKPQRSIQANKYLHVCLSYFGCQIGETMEYVKRNYYKILCNPDTFIREREDKYLGRVKYLRSSSELDSSEFSLTVDRFRNWCSSNAGVKCAKILYHEEKMAGFYNRLGELVYSRPIMPQEMQKTVFSINRKTGTES